MTAETLMNILYRVAKQFVALVEQERAKKKQNA